MRVYSIGNITFLAHSSLSPSLVSQTTVITIKGTTVAAKIIKLIEN
jgi:hypothetical protein